MRAISRRRFVGPGPGASAGLRYGFLAPGIEHPRFSSLFNCFIFFLRVLDANADAREVSRTRLLPAP